MSRAIAMWSGPRNISTAMMRAWENRSDCAVVDEPFYACYLHETGADHPYREAILASQAVSREAVIQALIASQETPLFYQKHMTHHMPVGCDLSWTRGLSHVFLIRSPSEVIASYLAKMPSVTESDIGIVRQRALYEEIAQITGVDPIVIDGADVLRDPEALLKALCAALDIPWSDRMLSWPAGPRDSDGVWAPHWYQVVESSTRFGPYRAPQQALPAQAQALALAMDPYYEALASRRLRPKA
jgi:hypothetical protein